MEMAWYDLGICWIRRAGGKTENGVDFFKWWHTFSTIVCVSWWKTYHPSFPPKSSWSGGGFSYGLGAKSFAGSSHAHSSSNPAPARHPSGVSDDIAKLRRARSEESEKSRLLELAEEEEYAEEKSRFLEELFRYKPWLLWDRRMIENARFSELKQRFFICKDEKSIDLSSSEALKEVEYIKREVWSKRDLPRESKSDMELLDDARFYNSKSGDFLRTRYSRATAYQRLGLTRTASKSDVRKAFRVRMLFLFHTFCARMCVIVSSYR